MKLTIVGATGSMSGPESAASSYLLQEESEGRIWSVLFDMGPGAFGQLWRYMDPKDLDAVFFSHGHADHMGDIISLYVHHRWNPEGKLPELPIYGPRGIRERTLQIDGWATAEEFAGIFDFRHVEPGTVVDIGPMHISAYPGNHTVESYGFRVETPSGSFAYTGDTDACQTMIDMANGVDLLLGECGFTAADEPRGIHLDGARLGQLASDSGVGKLVVTHIQPWTDPQTVVSEIRSQWVGPLEIARSAAVHDCAI